MRLALGERRPLYVTVDNRGGATWPWGLDQHPQVRVSYHWRAADGRMLVHDGHRSPLPCSLRPGESTIVPTWVEAPAAPGGYVLEIDLVHEHVRWFDAPLVVAVLVADRPGPPSPAASPPGSSSSADAPVPPTSAPDSPSSPEGPVPSPSAPASPSPTVQAPSPATSPATDPEAASC